MLVAGILDSTRLHAQAQVETARQYVAANVQQQKLAPTDIDGLTVSSSYLSPSTGWYHVYFNQAFQNIEVYNRMMNVVLMNNQVSYMNHNFVSSLGLFPKMGTVKSAISPVMALQKAASNVGLAMTSFAPIQELTATKLADGTLTRATYSLSELSNEKIDVKLYWLPVEKEGKGESRLDRLALSWGVRLLTKDGKNRWNIHVDATSGEILRKVDEIVRCDFGTPNHLKAPHECKGATLSGDAQYFGVKKESKVFTANGYTVFDYPVESPTFGSRTESVNPYNRFVTTGTGPGPTNGWHHDGVSSYSITRGNNVWAQEDVNDNDGTGFSPGSATLEFNFPYTAGPNTAAGNQSAAITNLFYWNNLIHDVLYKFGFDEPSGNFQNNNGGRGGLGNDFVYADAQDGGGTDNANFDTPPDGQNGRMQMYLWTSANQPDGDFDNGIIAHEYGHGWSIRLTGGPANSSCLDNAEQGGEGWSDFLGLMLTTNWASLSPNLASANIPRGIGTYALGQSTTGPGIRPYQYSYDMVNVNGPVTYGKVNNAHASTFPRPHGIGSIWATMLWDMTWAIIMNDNFIDPNVYNTPSNVADMRGNVAAFKLVNEGLRLQPCSPSFVQARDAILQADRMLFGGRYQCVIGQAFARRGLGGGASTGSSTNDRVVTESFTPIDGFGLISPTAAIACTGTPFSYTGVSNGSSTNTFRWQRNAVAGISNGSATANLAVINETLINTTNDPITVQYSFTLTTSSAVCSGQPASATQVISVVVNPVLVPTVASYSICQNGTVPSGQGLEAPIRLLNTFNGALTTSSPTYVRNNTLTNTTTYVSGGPTVYYQAFSFTAPTSGVQTFEVTGSTFTNNDSFLSLYETSFNPGSPATNFLRSVDDDGVVYLSKFTHTLTAGTTYVVVVSTYATGITGNFTFRLSAPVFSLGAPNWYATATGGSPLASSTVFNPVGVSGSGIPNTNTAGITTFYVSSPGLDACRTATTFTILSNAAPVASGSTTVTAGTSITLNATGCTDPGSILKWYRTSDNVEVSMPVSPTVTTQYYARCQRGNCLSGPSANVTVTIAVFTAFNSVQVGNWNAASTWNCNCVPDGSLPVEVSHAVTVPTGYTGLSKQRVKLLSGGRVIVSGTGKVKLVN
ncbi:hypothetical protein GCM10028807_43440 [Spirosoma daeguense]